MSVGMVAVVFRIQARKVLFLKVKRFEDKQPYCCGCWRDFTNEKGYQQNGKIHKRDKGTFVRRATL